MIRASFESDVGCKLYRSAEGNVAALGPPLVLFLIAVRAVPDAQVLRGVVLNFYPGSDGSVQFLEC